jgi:DNA-binding Lrp family transcriptional regulator
MKMSEIAHNDEKDTALIRIAHEDAGACISDIARRLDMKFMTTRYRVKTLEQQGYISTVRTRSKVKIFATALGIEQVNQASQNE